VRQARVADLLSSQPEASQILHTFWRDMKRFHMTLSFLLGLLPPSCQGKRQESERNARNNRSGHRGRNLFAQCHKTAEADDGDGD
jgi:hypothetical protein